MFSLVIEYSVFDLRIHATRSLTKMADKVQENPSTAIKNDNKESSELEDNNKNKKKKVIPLYMKPVNALLLDNAINSQSNMRQTDDGTFKEKLEF